MNHAERAILESFRVSGEIHLPPDASRDMDYITPTPGGKIRQFRKARLSRAKSLAKGGECSGRLGSMPPTCSGGCWVACQGGVDIPTPHATWTGRRTSGGETHLRIRHRGEALSMGGLSPGPKGRGSGRNFDNIRNLLFSIWNPGANLRMQISGSSPGGCHDAGRSRVACSAAPIRRIGRALKFGRRRL